MVGFRLNTFWSRATSPKPANPYTPDMVSLPLALCKNYDFDTIPHSLNPMLDYISVKLAVKSIHIILIVGRGRPSSTAHDSDLVIVPTSPFDDRTWRIFQRIIQKASKRFLVGQSWITALRQIHKDVHENEYLIHRSVIQNEILHRTEGLTVLSIDRLYTFKHRLHGLSRGTTHVPWRICVQSCVKLLRQVIDDLDGRPLSKSYILRAYDHLQIDDEVLCVVAQAYEDRYGEVGIVKRMKMCIQPPAPAPQPKSHPEITTSPASTSSSRSRLPTKTPISASDITPVTRGEWNDMFGQVALMTSHRGVVGLVNLEDCAKISAQLATITPSSPIISAPTIIPPQQAPPWTTNTSNASLDRIEEEPRIAASTAPSTPTWTRTSPFTRHPDETSSTSDLSLKGYKRGLRTKFPRLSRAQSAQFIQQTFSSKTLRMHCTSMMTGNGGQI